MDQPFAAPLVVEVTNSNGNPVAGVSVIWTIEAGSAAFATSPTTTNAAGQASVQVTASATAGPLTIIAQAGTLSVQFALTAAAAAALFTVTNMAITSALVLNSNAQPNYCATPSSKGSFLTTDLSVGV